MTQPFNPAHFPHPQFPHEVMNALQNQRRNAAYIAIQSSIENLRNNPPPADAPTLLMQAVIVPGGETPDGLLIAAAATPWFEIMRLIKNDPNLIYKIDWRKWEELVAAAYTRDGFDEVILTPRSGDHGRDIIATKHGVGSIKIFDQVKAYSPGHIVKADEVRAMSGVIAGAGNVSKGIITTTSTFAPGIENDPFLKPLIPFRIELKPRDVLLEWLGSLLPTR